MREFDARFDRTRDHWSKAVPMTPPDEYTIVDRQNGTARIVHNPELATARREFKRLQHAAQAIKLDIEHLANGVDGETNRHRAETRAATNDQTQAQNQENQ